MRMKEKNPHNKVSRGFTLYYAALFAGVLVIIGGALLNLALKEFRLSATLRDSEYAFFAADSGTECALYWDLVGTGNPADPAIFPNYHNFAKDGNNTVYHEFTGVWDPTANDQNPYTNYGPMRCNGNTAVAPTVLDYGPRFATTSISFNTVVDAVSYCSIVYVGKHIVDLVPPEVPSTETVVLTIIDAHGYNMPCSSPGVLPSSNRLIERAYVTRYPRQ